LIFAVAGNVHCVVDDDHDVDEVIATTAVILSEKIILTRQNSIL